VLLRPGSWRRNCGSPELPTSCKWTFKSSEVKLGTKLFIRGERRVELTDAGSAVMLLARKALLAAKAGAGLAVSTRRGERNRSRSHSCLQLTFISFALIKLLVEAAGPAIWKRLRCVAPGAPIERLPTALSRAGVSTGRLEDEVATTLYYTKSSKARATFARRKCLLP